jgi:TRAP-type C4-dicarboxylate transport system permease small subunit
MNLIDRIMHEVVNYCTYIGTLALASVMLIIVSNVIYRALGGALPGTYDLVETVTVVVAAFALTSTELAKKHTNVDALISHMKEKPRIWLEQFCDLISFFYWLTICWATVRVTIDKAKVGEVTDMLKVSIVPFRVGWCFALFLMALIVVYNVYRNFRELTRIEP